MSEPDLLPCPFCGSKAVLEDSGYGFYVVCGEDGLQCNIGQRDKNWTAEWAVKMWNRRTALKPPKT